MVSWVTTGCDTIDLILMGLRNSLSASSFSFILNATSVKLPKPAPDIYCHALKRAGIGPDNAIAIEDTPESASFLQPASKRSLFLAGRRWNDVFHRALSRSMCCRPSSRQLLSASKAQAVWNVFELLWGYLAHQSSLRACPRCALHRLT